MIELNQHVLPMFLRPAGRPASLTKFDSTPSDDTRSLTPVGHCPLTPATVAAVPTTAFEDEDDDVQVDGVVCDDAAPVLPDAATPAFDVLVQLMSASYSSSSSSSMLFMLPNMSLRFKLELHKWMREGKRKSKRLLTWFDLERHQHDGIHSFPCTCGAACRRCSMTETSRTVGCFVCFLAFVRLHYSMIDNENS